MQVFRVTKKRDLSHLVQEKEKNLLIVKTHIDYHWKAFIFLCSLCLSLPLSLHSLLFLPPSRVFTWMSPPTHFIWSASHDTFSAPISMRLTGKSYLISNTQPRTQGHLFEPSHKSHQSSDSLWIDCTFNSAIPWSNSPAQEEGVEPQDAGVVSWQPWQPVSLVHCLSHMLLSFIPSDDNHGVKLSYQKDETTSKASGGHLIILPLLSACTPGGELPNPVREYFFLSCLSSCEWEGNGAFRESWVRSLGWEDSLEKGNGYPLQYSGWQNSMDYIVHGVTKSHTWLIDFHSLYPIDSFLPWNCSQCWHPAEARAHVSCSGPPVTMEIRQLSRNPGTQGTAHPFP